MENTTKSYIATNKPEVLVFFKEYWSYLKKYYVIVDDKDWWGCFMSDMCYYVDTYSNNNLYVNLIMALYVRNIGDYKKNDIHYLSGFFKNWWAVFNEYYEPIGNDDKKQGAFVNAIQGLYDKYSQDTFFRDCIDILYDYKMPEVKTNADDKFMKYIYEDA